MAILYQAPPSRARRHAALAVAALAVGAVLAWLLLPSEPAPASMRPVRAVAGATVNAAGARSATAIDTGCDARCAVAKVIVPASTACGAAVEELAGFGARWLDEDAATQRFDRFAWLQSARGTVTLGGGRAEFRNAAGAWLPVDYDCDFDPAMLAVLEARARPR